MVLTAVLATAGFLCALLFVTLERGVLRLDAHLLPAFCRLDEGSCGRVLEHRHVRVFGPPNALLGLASYGVLLLWSTGGFLPAAHTALCVVSWGVVGVSLFLAWFLFVVVRVRCVVCLVAHGLNCAVAVNLTAFVQDHGTLHRFLLEPGIPRTRDATRPSRAP